MSSSFRGAVLVSSIVLLNATILVPAQPVYATGPPAFVQQVTGHGLGVTRAVTTPNPTTAGNRLVVEVGVWNSGSATVSAVTDNAGDTFVKILSFTASDHTEMSVWTAVVVTGGTKPTITARATSSADLGIAALEYSGLSTASVVDQERHAAGTTGSTAATVSSGATAPTTAGGELALGLYADSGFGATLTPGTGFTQRANLSPTGDMELLVEDQIVAAGATPNGGAGTAARTTWLMATVVLRAASSTTPTAPQAPSGVAATPGDGSATVTWTAPGDGGSQITSYAVTPSAGGVAQAPTTVAGSPPPTTATVNGLTNGTEYTFTVTATNGVGTGPASTASAPVTPGPQAGGSWSGLQTWPIVALSNTLLYNGSVVAWDGWQQPQPTVVWNPASPQAFNTFNAPTSVFCDGAASLPDGRLLVVGGYGGLTTGQLGIVDTNIFDPATNTWSRVADMHRPRWYPTVTELADGRYVAISGNDTDASHWADTPEVYDPATNTWTLLSGVSTPQVHETEYPFSYLLPSGKVFTIGPNEDNSFLLDVNNQTWTPVGGTSGVHNGSSVMYRPGKVLYSGGGVDVNRPGSAFKTTAVIDLNAATPTWQQTAPMNNARVYHTLTMLPDGKVLAVGGNTNTDQGIVTSGMLPAEIWDPATQTWTAAAPMAAARNYHSTALLMPDARVLVAGGGHPFGSSGAAQYSAQYYSPAYLSNGPRPTITSTSGGGSYGGTISVSTPDATSITAVNLVSLGADTHQMDMNQHFVPLSFTKNGSGLTVQAPAGPELAPPGYYMLFILNGNGVPSVASMVQIGANPTAPAAPTAVTATPADRSANVSWKAPPGSGSPITSYTVTPYIGTTAQLSTTVTGNPPATSATIPNLTNGAAYTFKVTATNAIGTSPPSAPSAAVTPGIAPPPTFVQHTGTQSAGSDSLSATLPAVLGSGNRLIVEVGTWSGAGAVTTGVTDAAGDQFVEVARWKAPDSTELSVWTAPVTAGAGQSSAVTAQVSGPADIGVDVLEYAGLSTVADASVVDQQATASGTTSVAATVRSGATPPTTGGNELAVGFYADSGFGKSLTGGTGWTVRGNVSPNGNMDLLTEDQVVAAGATPNAAVGTGSNTIWLLGTLVFKAASTAPPTAPSAPTGVTASAADGSARVTWTAPGNGGSAITSYTVTPYVGATAQAPTTVSGSPPSTTGTIGGLTNGTTYTFTVSATNTIGDGPQSAPSAPVTPGVSPPAPAFVQQVSAKGAGRTSLAVATPQTTTRDNRLIVQVGVWSAGSATVNTVTDNAGDTFTKVTSFTASDHTQMSVWTAVVNNGGTKPTITASVSGAADVGVAALEYAGLSTAAGAAAVDQQATATGTTSGALAVQSAATNPATADGELALGFYADSGFGTLLVPDPAYNARTNLSPNGNMDLLVEDLPVSAGARPAASATTGASTVWLMATVVFNHA
ncbi:Kelch motif-containing protein [Micromonospora inositola]|uniref:Kelch motif-containing protein n=1 Tax=Micromonospora inositola TaxID=47865 RepID=A0A1C5J6D6_9ACTN|nr:Kelch motif-containing protein [Micromonospora inositola]